jgi:hypothetical protein
MKYFVAFLLLMSISAQSKVEFKVSPVHGLVKFAELLAEENVAYWGLIGNKEKPKVREKVNQFIKLKNRSLSSGFSTGSQKVNGESGGNVWHVFIWQSILSKDLKDFTERLTGLMTVHTQEQMMSILNDLKPHYDLFWNKNKGHLYKFIKKANPVINRSDRVTSVIDSIRVFYGTTWPKNKPFPIGLYLLPKTAKVSGATSFDTFEEASIKPEEELYGRLGVIIHEMCHSYYANQKDRLYKEMKNYYKGSKSSFAHHAYNYMNESLATVLGNGIAYEAMSKKVDKTTWYNDEIIDGFAHALYPLTATYIKNNKTMDADYFKSSINDFEKQFPNMNKRLKYLLNKPLFSITGSVDQSKVQMSLFNKMKIQGFRTSSPFVHPYTREYFDLSKSPLILIVDDWNQKTREGIGKMYPELYTKVATVLGSKKGWGYFFESGRFNLVIKYVDQKQYLSIIDDIYKTKEVR